MKVLYQGETRLARRLEAQKRFLYCQEIAKNEGRGHDTTREEAHQACEAVDRMKAGKGLSNAVYEESWIHGSS